MIAYRGLLTNLAAIAAMTYLGVHGVTGDTIYLSLAAVAGVHAARAAVESRAKGGTGG